MTEEHPHEFTSSDGEKGIQAWRDGGYDHDTAAQPQSSEQIQQAIDILSMQDNAGKGQTKEELARRNQQALDVLRSGAASSEQDTGDYDKYILGQRKIEHEATSEQICGCQDGEDCHICRDPASATAAIGTAAVAGSEPQWTVEADEFEHDWIRTADGEHMSSLHLIAAAHNAALAEKQAGIDSFRNMWSIDYDKLHDKAVHWQDEALAERERRKPLVDLLGECRCKLDWSVTDGKFLAKIDAALAQAKGFDRQI